MIYSVRFLYLIGEEHVLELREYLSAQEMGAKVAAAVDNGLKTANGFIQPKQIVAVGVFASVDGACVPELADRLTTEQEVDEWVASLDDGLDETGEPWTRGAGEPGEPEVVAAEAQGAADPDTSEPGEPEVADLVAQAELDALEDLLGVNYEQARALWNEGLHTADDLRAADDQALADIQGIGRKTVAKIRERLGQ